MGCPLLITPPPPPNVFNYFQLHVVKTMVENTAMGHYTVFVYTIPVMLIQSLCMAPELPAAAVSKLFSRR